MVALLWVGLLTTQLCNVNITYDAYIAYAYVPKSLSRLIVNDNNCFFYDNIIVYNLHPFIDTVILQFPIRKLSMLFFDVIFNLKLNNIITMLFFKKFTYLGYEKRMKSTNELTRHINIYMS